MLERFGIVGSTSFSFLSLSGSPSGGPPMPGGRPDCVLPWILTQRNTKARSEIYHESLFDQR